MSSDDVTARAIRAKKRQRASELAATAEAVKKAAKAASASGTKRKEPASDKDEKQQQEEAPPPLIRQKRSRLSRVDDDGGGEAPASAAASAVAAAAAAATAAQKLPYLNNKEVKWDDFDDTVATEYGLITNDPNKRTASDFGTFAVGDYVCILYRREVGNETETGYMIVDDIHRDVRTGKIVVSGRWLWSLKDFRDYREMTDEIETLTADEPDVLIQSTMQHQCGLQDVSGHLEESRIPTLLFDVESHTLITNPRREDGAAAASVGVVSEPSTSLDTDAFVAFLAAEEKFMCETKYGADLFAYTDRKVERLRPKQTHLTTGPDVVQSLLKGWRHGTIHCDPLVKRHDGMCGLCGRRQQMTYTMKIDFPENVGFDALGLVKLDACCATTVVHIVRLRNLLSTQRQRWRDYTREKRMQGVYLRDWQEEIRGLMQVKEPRRSTYIPVEAEKETMVAAAAAATMRPAAAAAAAVFATDVAVDEFDPYLE